MRRAKRKPIRKVVSIRDFNDPKGLGWIKRSDKYKGSILNRFLNWIQKVLK